MIQLGGSMDPEAAFLLIRGMKTLGMRMGRQCENAMAVARYLSKHPKVARVHYPGLAFASRSQTGQAADARIRRNAGVRLKGGLPAARRFCDRVRVFLLAASLGGVESLVVLPIYTRTTKCRRRNCARRGFGPGTVRVSVGLEDPGDLDRGFAAGAGLREHVATEPLAVS